jgi:uncharacterized protein (DUF433 family)
MPLTNLPLFLTADEHGEVRLTGHRIGLEDVVHFYNEGYSPEMLLGQFPTLSLPLIHKTIAYYLENEAEVHRYLQENEAAVARHRAAATKGPDVAELRRRLAAQPRAQTSRGG